MTYPRWLLNRLLGEKDSANEGLSMLDLVNSGTVDCKLAALLWLVMEQRASAIVASGPIYAGKTTLLHAILDFLPPGVQQIPLKGYFEDFAFLGYSKADKSYLVAEEISNHGYYDYLWGAKAVRTLKLLSQGYSLGATIHARSSEEVAHILHGVLGISISLLSHLGIIINLRATAGQNYDDDPIRRVTSVDLVIPHEEGLGIQVLAARRYTEKGFDYQSEKTLQQALTGKNLIGKYDISAELEARKLFLKHLLKEGKLSRGEVREAVSNYYRARTAQG